jgi:hypothetical protein
MPEIKHQFTGGKMNKDLDERLVPNGEYRDAMNIQVATSESSEVGTAQNVLGNELQTIFHNGVGYDLPGEAVTIGAISDEKNDTLYYLVWTSNIDYIISYDGAIHTMVFVDKTKEVLKFANCTIITGINIIDDMLFWTDNINEPRKINIPRCIKGTSWSASNTPNQTELYNTATDELTEIKEEHITVIKKGPQYSLDMVMKTHRSPEKMYTGVIKIFDNDEPANSGPNVGSSFIGQSFDDGIFDFSSISTDPGSNKFSVEILTGLDASSNEVDLLPVSPGPGTLEALTGWIPPGGTIQSLLGQKVVLQAYQDDGTGAFTPPSVPLTDFVIKGEITALLGDVPTIPFNPIVPTFVPQSNSQSGLTNLVVPQPPLPALIVPSYYGIEIKITTVDGFPEQPKEDGQQLKYVIDIFEETEKLFEFKFPRFSHRYKYEDGEYSTFAPFTQVAFIPGAFDYHPRKGYNLGMTNKLRDVELFNIVTTDTPKDVVAIDILFKDDSSPSVYVVDTIKPDDWAAPNDFNLWDKLLQSSENPNVTPLFGFLISKEAINSVVPSNQLLRPWDNVPKKALGQDVTGNRVVYANYVQNYDLFSLNGKNYVPNLNVTTEEFSSVDNLLFNPGTNVGTSAYKSIKSLREYQLGVVFIDEFGRETPVLSNTSSTVRYEKDKADTANRFQVQFDSDDFPQALTYFKFFVKETSSEYYNLAMDRFYGAGDGNLWLSFPSSDRNKVDIDTFLIMKKGTDSDTLVTDAARYKILAIEGEAPDFIKTTKRKLVSLKNGGGNLFTTSLPTSGTSDFKISTQALYGTAGQDIDKIPVNVSELWVEFERTGTTQVSDRYKIIGVSNSHIEKTDPITAHEFAFRLDRPLEDDVNFISNDPTGATSNSIENTAIVNIYRYTVENLDRFDGRFFVKIYFDDTFKQNIVADIVGGGIRKVASRKVYLMDEKLIEKHTTDLSNFATRGRGVSRNAVTNWSGPKFYLGSGNDNLLYGYYTVNEFTANALYFRRYREKRYGMGGAGDYGVETSLLASYIDKLNDDTSYNIRALIHLERETSPGNNSDGEPWIKYKSDVIDSADYWKDSPFWYEEFGYGTHRHSHADRYIRRTSRNAHGVTSGWKRHKTELGKDSSLDWDFSSGSEVDFAAYSYIEHPGGYVSDRDSAKDTDVWFIDKGPSAGIYPDADSESELKFNREPLAVPINGGGLVENGPTWNLDLGFGGVIPPSASGTSVWNGKEDVPGFWDVGDWNSYNTAPANSNYFDERNFISRVKDGYQFTWDEDNTNDGLGVRYIVGGTVRTRNMFRHSDGRHLPHYHSDGSYFAGDKFAKDHAKDYNNEEFSAQLKDYVNHNPDDLHSMAEGLSFNMSKRWVMNDIEPQLEWDPTTIGIINNGLSISATVVDVNGSDLATSTASLIDGPNKQDDLVIYVATINEVINSVQRTIHQGMALTGWTSAGAAVSIEENPYVVREIEQLNDDVYMLLLGGYKQPFLQAEHDFLFNNAPDIGTNYTFQQVGMNGYSPNSEFNINTIAKPKPSGVGPNLSLWGAVGAVGYTLSWYDSLEESEIMSENPAIFETEPKDTTELDIYYEASGSMPTVINDNTISSAAPIGTRVQIGGYIYTVMGYNNSQLLVQQANNTIFAIGIGPVSITAKFFRPDDLIVELKITHLGITTDPNMWTLTLENQVVDPNNKFILPWHNCYTFRNGVESNRIRDNYNLPYISNGVKASTTLEQEYREEHRKYGLIYSGIYNSVSGINNLNQFIQAEKITKDVNPIYGSIQKLYSRNSDLVALCEDKVLRISANKDAVFNADGNPQLIATDRVLGQTIPFKGEYGISTNPESFAAESFRAYFTDRVRGAVIRMSMDGLTPISDFGMKDWFRDNLRLTRKAIGSFDDRNQEYNIKLKNSLCVDIPFIEEEINFCKDKGTPYGAATIYQTYDVILFNGFKYSYQGPPGATSPPPPNWNWVLCPGQEIGDPCDDYPGDLIWFSGDDFYSDEQTCCDKCDQYATGSPLHPCYDFCIRWQDCCPDKTGCTDPLAENYDPSVPAGSDDGSCLYCTGDLPLGSQNFGVQSPNELNMLPDTQGGVGGMWGTTGALGQNTEICVFPPSPGSPVFGAHITKNFSSGSSNFELNGEGNHKGNVYTESHYWNVTCLTPGQTYKIRWKEIVLALRTQPQCSDCLMGGWAIRTDAIQAPTLNANGGMSVQVSYNDLNIATPIYDPVVSGTLSQANTGYHQSNCSQDTSNTSTNTAGASNGSESEWHDRCTTFTASAPSMRIHMIAFTDFNQCTSCYSHTTNRHGSYVGLSELELTSGSC